MSKTIHYIIYTGILICMVITNIMTANTINDELEKVHNGIISVQENFHRVYNVCIAYEKPDLYNMLEWKCKDPETEYDYEKCKQYNLIGDSYIH